ncbi:MAG: hypothetical protein IPP71_07550 [Bacteroidetes bacterium]|nr:hypothetical protein [Bacteroidota bacterium]
MTNIESKKISIIRNLILIVFTLQISSCTGQVIEKPINDTTENGINNQPINLNQRTTFPQIHTNLNGMVREFVRTMYQDKKGNYWFGTNGDGIIRYDGQTLEKIIIEGINSHLRITGIIEDKAGHIWFGSDELIKYDGEKFTAYTKKDGLPAGEIFGLTIDKSGLIWIGSTGGISLFDGKKFTPFLLPDTKIEDPKPMLSAKLVFNFLEDKNGTMWLVTDGNGIFKFKNGEFIPFNI